METRLQRRLNGRATLHNLPIELIVMVVELATESNHQGYRDSQDHHENAQQSSPVFNGTALLAHLSKSAPAFGSSPSLIFQSGVR